MRDIKFRAWDDKKKQWLLGYDYGSLGGFSLFGECVMMGEWEGVLRTFFSERGDYKFENLKVMQYTGLKDKNGKEIYEGDIYKTNNGGSLHLVSYRTGAFCGSYIGSDEKPEPLGWTNNEEDRNQNWLEVIGNIYKNPDLLKCK